MRVRIYLDTFTQAKDFCQAISFANFNGRAELVSGNGAYRVNAQSFLGCMLAHSEWGKDGIWFESDEDLYSLVEPWINVENGDGNFIHE